MTLLTAKPQPTFESSGTSLGPALVHHILYQHLAQLQERVLLVDGDIVSLIDRLEIQNYEAGDLILPQGSRADCMGLVTQGQVGVYDPAADRNRLTAVLLPGGVFGESMLVEGAPSSHTYRALTDAQAGFLRRQDLLDVAGQRWRRLSVRVGRWARRLAAGATLLIVLGILWALPGARRAFALLPYSAGLWLGKQGCSGGASFVLSLAQKAATDWPAPHLARGNLYLASGRLREAETALQRALALNPKAAEAWNSMGLIHASRGDHRAATRSFQRALETDPGQSTVIANLGCSLQFEGKVEAALRQYALARSIGETEPAMLVNEAMAHYASADLPAAQETAQRALELDASLAPAYTLLAGVRLAEGQWLDAHLFLERALDLDAAYAPAHFLSGLLAKSQSLQQPAIDAFQRVLMSTRDPKTLEQARLHLAELYTGR